MKLQTKYRDVLRIHHLAFPVVISHVTTVHYQNQKSIVTIKLTRLQILVQFYPFLNSLIFASLTCSSMMLPHVYIF